MNTIRHWMHAFAAMVGSLADPPRAYIHPKNGFVRDAQALRRDGYAVSRDLNTSVRSIHGQQSHTNSRKA
jgi:hypothetical protein